MSQILDPIPHGEGDSILCCYINATNQIQIARITNVPNWYFERVVFPGQRLVFEAVSSGILEIHSGMMASAILSDSIPCQRLAVQNFSQSPPPERSPQANSSNSATLKDRNQKTPTTANAHS
jgi:hypothetical protein